MPRSDPVADVGTGTGRAVGVVGLGADRVVAGRTVVRGATGWRDCRTRHVVSAATSDHAAAVDQITTG